MTPLLLFSYALAGAGGLLLLGVVVLLLFAITLWLLGGRASAQAAAPPSPKTLDPAAPDANLLASRAGSGITGHREH